MNLSKISNQELLTRLERLTKTERKITHLVLWHINEIESRRLFAELGFGSMYEYLTKHLGYGESSAYRRIQSARLLKQIPHLADKIEAGALNLTQLTQVQKCLKAEKKSGVAVAVSKTFDILKKIENKSALETQKVLAQEFNQPIQKHEILKPQADQSIRIELTLTQEQMQFLQEAKDLFSHILPDAGWADLVSFLAKKQIDRVKGKVRPQISSVDLSSVVALADEMLPTSPLETQMPLTQGFCVKQKRSYISLKIKRVLFNRAKSCCEYVDPNSGRKCESHFQLQIDHCIPLARGGSHEIDNMRLLCRTHNLLAAQTWGLSRQ